MEKLLIAALALALAGCGSDSSTGSTAAQSKAIANSWSVTSGGHAYLWDFSSMASYGVAFSGTTTDNAVSCTCTFTLTGSASIGTLDTASCSPALSCFSAEGSMDYTYDGSTLSLTASGVTLVCQ